MSRTAATSTCLTAAQIFLLTGFLSGLSVVQADELPVGDGKVTDHAVAGNVYACETTFRGGGAQHTGPWFHGDTWDPDAKPHVKGRVMWPQAVFAVMPSGARLAISGNGLPVGQPTGVFPIGRDDPVYRYDTNPNAIATLNLSFTFPATPQRAATPGCLPMGMIGFTVTGVALYNALDAAGRDAAAHEVQDLCDGHPQGRGQYHYHSSSPCLPGAEGDGVIGWGLDGYPILGMGDGRGGLLSNADLDACHGRAETVSVDGRRYDYAYRLTREYPYVMGCFAGVVPDGTQQAIRRGMGPPRDRGPQGMPPPDGRRPPLGGRRPPRDR
jgi:hypothetical protein